MMAPFDFPPTADSASPPAWQGNGFAVDGRTLPILEYSENFAGWSDELTTLHEDAAGSSHPIDVASRRDALLQLRRHLRGKSSPAILEIGCSSGFMLKAIVAAFPSAFVMGADVVRAPLLRLAVELPTVPLLRFDLLQCPLPLATFDAIVILNVLEHIEDDVAAMKQLHRLLKPGGVVIAEVPAGPNLYDAYDEALRHFRRYGMRELIDKFSSAGLVPLRRSYLGFVVYPAFCLAKWRNRRRRMTVEAKSRVVQEQASRTASSGAMRVAFAIDGLLRDTLPLPWGIRCLLVAGKRKSNA
jgi:SAM-dependent methyltransferase